MTTIENRSQLEKVRPEKTAQAWKKKVELIEKLIEEEKLPKEVAKRRIDGVKRGVFPFKST